MSTAPAQLRDNYWMKDKDVAAVLGYSVSHSQKIIRRLNDERKAKGLLVVSGRIPRSYLLARYGIPEDAMQ